MTAIPGSPDRRDVPPWRNVRVLRIAAQVVVLLLIGIVVALMAANMLTAMDERGLGFGFSFLGRQAGFDISETPVDYSSSSTYTTAFLVGLINTLFVSILGIILSTLLGIVVGVARLSSNWLVGRIAAAYVELFRNTPLLVQLFIIYFAVFLQLPSVVDSLRVGDAVILNQRGVFLPAPVPQGGLLVWLALVGIAVAVAVIAMVIAGRREAAGRPIPRLRLAGILVAGAIVVVGWVLVGGPVALEIPVQERFNLSGGLRLSPEFTALLLGLVLYTAAFIGEIVRGGIQAVRRGQLEAARALGLSEGQVLRLVVFPQAMRIIVPPLTSQYLNLTKNSSLAIAIGYPDLFKVGQTMANQTGQPVSVMILVMGTYLAISLATSAVMNLYNRRVQVAER
jgi:general L-amino acid transport system permease protein